MDIDSTTGEITWTPTAESDNNAVVVRIRDVKGDSLIHSFDVDCDIDAFRFVATTGNNINDGAEANPWASLGYACSTANSTNFIYIKAGTYTGSFLIKADDCGRVIAYPGDSVYVICGSGGSGGIWLQSGDGNMIFQGIDFDASDRSWLFVLNSSSIQNIIWRKNNMHNVTLDVADNPAFIYSTDAYTDLRDHYKNLVVQDNKFYDNKSKINHGGALVWYDVSYSLVEDNEIYDIQGHGIHDKDNGNFNTFRNNYLHDNKGGISLSNQWDQQNIDVSYNRIIGAGVVVGGQPSAYIKNIYIYNNTIVNAYIHFSDRIDYEESGNINVYKNIITNTKNGNPYYTPYSLAATGQLWYLEADTNKVNIDSNIIWCNKSKVLRNVVDSNATFDKWQYNGLDVNSIVAKPYLNNDYTLPVFSQYRGFGSDIKAPLPKLHDSTQHAYIIEPTVVNDTTFYPIVVKNNNTYVQVFKFCGDDKVDTSIISVLAIDTIIINGCISSTIITNSYNNTEFADNFNYANGVYSNADITRSKNSKDFDIVDGKLKNSTGGGNPIVLYNHDILGETFVEFIIDSTYNVYNKYFRSILYSDSVNENSYDLRIFKDSLDVRKKINKFNDIQIIGKKLSSSITTNDKIRFYSDGDSLKIDINEINILSVFDNSLRVGMSGVGMRCDALPCPYIDDLKIGTFVNNSIGSDTIMIIGGEPPTIDTILQLSGPWGRQVKFVGSNFDGVDSVFLNSVKCTVDSVSSNGDTAYISTFTGIRGYFKTQTVWKDLVSVTSNFWVYLKNMFAPVGPTGTVR